jgi:integrase
MIFGRVGIWPIWGPAMPLTDIQIKKAKPGPKTIKLSDGGGLQLWLEPDGARRWRLAYRFSGKQRTLAVGVYPAIGLKEARDAREAAKALLADGKDPSGAKRAEKVAKARAAGHTFNAIADELVEKSRRETKAARTQSKLAWLLSLARPALGPRPITEISAADVLAVLRTVEGRGRLETAKRLRATIGQVFRYAVATARAENDPTSALKGALTAPTVTHRPAITDPVAFGALLRAMAGDTGGAPETRAALELLALTFVRPGELRAAEWSEFDLDAAVWTIPAEKMKMRRPHRVPLAPRAVTILKDLRTIASGSKYVFPSVRTGARPMSENTINAALRRLGFSKEQMTAHGFRAAASSMLNECGLFSPDAIEASQSRLDQDAIRRAYNRSEYWSERVKIMNYWADRCDAMRRGGDIVAFQPLLSQVFA